MKTYSTSLVTPREHRRRHDGATAWVGAMSRGRKGKALRVHAEDMTTQFREEIHRHNNEHPF